MPRKRDTVDIIKALVALLTPTISITSQVDNLDGTFTLLIPNTHWLTGGVKKLLNIDSIDYRVQSFVINESITIKPEKTSDPAPSVNSFMLDAPHFLHGTTEMAVIDQLQSMDPNLRLPFIYLIEPLEETDIKDEENPWGRESRPRLYFMDESITAWNPPTHKTNVIESVRQMVELFFSKIQEEEDNLYREVLECTEIAAADWGKLSTDKGYKGKFFSDTVSGLQIGFDFVMSKTACEDIVEAVQCTLTINVEASDESSIGAGDGTAQSNVTGESSPANLSILWTTIDGTIPAGTETNADLEDLVSGTYTATATDSGIQSCVRVGVGTVSAPTAELFMADFDGANFLSQSNAYFKKTNTSFTMFGWLVADDVSGSFGIIGKWFASGNQRGYLLFHLGDKLVMFLSSNGSSASSATSTITIVQGNKYFFAAGYDAVNDLVFISVENETIVTASHTGGVFDTSADFEIGKANTASFMNGGVDQGGIYDKPLTLPQMTTLKNGTTGTTVDDMDKVGLGPVWKFNELTGPRADSNGTLSLTDNNSVGRRVGIVLD